MIEYRRRSLNIVHICAFIMYFILLCKSRIIKVRVHRSASYVSDRTHQTDFRILIVIYVRPVISTGRTARIGPSVMPTQILRGENIPMSADNDIRISEPVDAPTHSVDFCTLLVHTDRPLTTKIRMLNVQNLIANGQVRCDLSNADAYL